LMSMPASVIQVGIAIQTRPRGRPDENERRETEPKRQLRVIAFRLAQVPRRSEDAAPPILGG